MNRTVISVENLSKSYRLGQIGTGTLVNDLKVWWAKAQGKPNPLLKVDQDPSGRYDGQLLWALKDVSFNVNQGDVLGIIGKNGAGKSTLLKIISRVTAPSDGKVKVKGRIASLLEVGTGFHPELTGRENVYLNGAILGMTNDEVRRKFDEIVEFAEISRFIDTPVKRYSSGMYVRLAFAVAAHLEPEILLVDEVLAVGDMEFQKKCLGKMGDVAKQGRTVLFVSHNMAAIQNLCSVCVYLNDGKVFTHDATNRVIETYLNSIIRPLSLNNLDAFRPDWVKKKYIKNIKLINENGEETTIFNMGENIQVCVEILCEEGDLVRDPVLGVVVNHDQRGTVGGINSRMKPAVSSRITNTNYTYTCILKSPPLLQGNYNLEIWFGNNLYDLDAVIGGVTLSIQETDIYGSGKLPFSHMGVIYFDADWKVDPLE